MKKKQTLSVKLKGCFFGAETGDGAGLHPLSPGWCTLSHVSYAALPRYCRNYALQIYYARRNRRNAPSVARFSLPCHPWQGISVYRVHNSTVSKQLRYALMRESVPQLVTSDEASYAVAKNIMTKYHSSATISLKREFTKEDKLIPVITITVYLGTKEWDGPRRLSDMFDDVDEELLPFIPDYRINLLAPREITDFTGFRTSIRQLFEVLQNAYDKEKMQEVLQNDENFSKVDRETVEAINLFAGTDIDIDEKEEVIDMCKAWEEQKNEGREEGRIRQAKITALKLQKKGHSIEDIAECVDFDEETVKKWLVS